MTTFSLRQQGPALLLGKMHETTGEGSQTWSDWQDHLDSVAEVNGWNAADKKKWVRARLTERAATAMRRLSEDDKASFANICAAMKKCFVPYEEEAKERRLGGIRRGLEKSGREGLPDVAGRDLGAAGSEQFYQPDWRPPVVICRATESSCDSGCSSSGGTGA